MTKDNYIAQLMPKLENHFEVYRNYKEGQYVFELYAQYTHRKGRTLISSVDVIDAYRQCEKCFVKGMRNDQEALQVFLKWLEHRVDTMETDKEHMYTAFTGVLLISSPSQQMVDDIQRYKYHKNYWCGLRGWSEIKLVVIDLDSNSLYTNKAAKDCRWVYEI